MIRAALFATTLALSAAIALPASAEDPRLVERLYNPAEVVRIDGRAKVQATIMFGDDEVIENVAIGDSQSWQVTPNKRANLLFVKPLSPTAATNMTVVTSQRTYLFDLVASPRSRPVYVLSFTYPKPPPSEDAERETANAAEMAAATDPYAVVDPTALNFAWEKTGDAALFPVRAFDDGLATFLSWPSDRSVPAILVKDTDGTEGPVNFTVRGDTIVVQGVPREIVLRSGDEAALLVNTGPERVASPLRDDRALAQAERAAKEAN
ncbi:TrbG/VirB9 family P-type conjugative transfer protein [Altererythrobacter sp. BO-6]|uniref:TrbG/VirB9 family P-type conjugative transfer protein n=1 Tax=Altererythrobacter sp. BO-6 TaxID=2604537 RepID=UPI0013E16FE5|nr:TrbG/VirB9 family P-type conjugative transfer protein [Altererythrobacter sp. BO-6]QIG53488.1 TrbG/VirB9 family P-type conjugative transfer protein [Altererythrobacter sp. BO-6]